MSEKMKENAGSSLQNHSMLAAQTSSKSVLSLEDESVPAWFERLINSEKNSVLTQQLNKQLGDLDIQKHLLGLAATCTTLQQSSDAMMSTFSSILSRTITQLNVTGLDKLDVRKTYIFISNHRDVLLDPLLINLALQQHGFTFARCAIGSNLLEDPLLECYLRLAGCFIVPRNKTNKREMVQGLVRLSHYIQSLIPEHHTWIAQREGRAKDGRDETNPALIKMLLLAKNPAESQSNFFARNSIVPVSIAYEWDPSDKEKAIELSLRQCAHPVEYRSDSIQHLQNSLLSPKGQVSLNFGQPLVISNDCSAAEIAKTLDQHIQSQFAIYDTHQVAYKAKNRMQLSPTESQLLQQLESRLGNQATPETRDNLLDLYANVVEQRLRWKGL